MKIVDTLVAQRTGPFLFVEVKSSTAKSVLALNGAGPLGLWSVWVESSSVLITSELAGETDNVVKGDDMRTSGVFRLCPLERIEIFFPGQVGPFTRRTNGKLLNFQPL